MVARRVLGHAVLERLGHRAQPGQRRAQVVAHPGDQVAAGRLERGVAVALLREPYGLRLQVADLSAQGHAHGDGDQPGHRADDEHDAEVVPGQEHPARGGDHPGGDRQRPS